jgi:hypothetical protein
MPNASKPYGFVVISLEKLTLVDGRFCLCPQKLILFGLRDGPVG